MSKGSGKEIKRLLDNEFIEAYQFYRNYFSNLDASGLSSFIVGADDLLGSFSTKGGEDFELDKMLYQSRLRAIVTALLEHSAAQQFKSDFAVLAELAGIVMPSKNEILH